MRMKWRVCSVATIRIPANLWEQNQRLATTKILCAGKPMGVEVTLGGLHRRGEGKVEAGLYSEDNCPAVKILDCCNSFFSFLCKYGGEIIGVVLRKWNRKAWRRSIGREREDKL